MTAPQPASVIITKNDFLAELDQLEPCWHCLSEPAVYIGPHGEWEAVVLHDRGCRGLGEQKASAHLRLLRDETEGNEP